MTDWPNQSIAALNKFYGNPDNGSGSADLDWQRANLTTIVPPYAMFYDGKKVGKITVHKKVADSLLRVLTKIGSEFSAAQRKQYGLDQFGGVFNFRRKRGGTGLSTHSWAIAIDLAVALNGFGVKYGSKPNMMPMRVVEIFQEEGWTWGGLWSNADAMHFQAADVAGQAKAPTPTKADDISAGKLRYTIDAITDAETITKVQTELKALGYTEVGDIDGKIGKMTRTAILAFRNEHDLPLVDYVDREMLAALWTAKPRELAPSRVEAKPAEVRAQVPEARAAWWTKISAAIAGAVATGGVVVDGVIDNLDGARGWLEPVKNVFGDIPTWMWFVALGAGAWFLWQKSRKGEVAIQTAFQTGERR